VNELTEHSPNVSAITDASPWDRSGNLNLFLPTGCLQSQFAQPMASQPRTGEVAMPKIAMSSAARCAASCRDRSA
jgi:hypothetical protein